MARLVAPPLSLYIHFPWCVRKCPYCDFNSYTLHGELPEESYIERLERDIRNQAVQVSGREIVSIFMGGGTPSLFAPKAIGRVLETARRHLRIADTVEVTMEANPGTIERGRFAEYRAAGINRVSLGAQSFNAQRLETLGRIHSPEETRRAAEELHACGLENFNLDLMYALPGQDVAAAVADLDAAIALQPTHLSHYQLTLESGTVFAAQPPPGLPDDDVAAEMLAACGDRLAAAGFEHYEVSAYARTGRRCAHNLNYWAFGDYLGVGAGAHGKLTFPSTGLEAPGKINLADEGSIVRTTQIRDPRRYLAGGEETLGRKNVPARDLPFEFMLNALRLVDGFEREMFAERTGLDWTVVASEIDHLTRRELLTVQDARLTPTLVGMRFLNEMLLCFVAESTGLTEAFGLSTAV